MTVNCNIKIIHNYLYNPGRSNYCACMPSNRNYIYKLVQCGKPYSRAKE